MAFYGFRSTKPKKIRDQKSCHMPPRAFDDTGVAASTNTCSHAPPVILTRLHALGLNTRATRHTRALWCHRWRLYDVTTHYGLTHLSRLTRFNPFILTWCEPPTKKN